METIKLWARNGDAVRQAIELGALVRRDTASAELTDAVLWWAIDRGLLTRWAESFPAPRCEPEISMEVVESAPQGLGHALWEEEKGRFGPSRLGGHGATSQGAMDHTARGRAFGACAG